MKFISLFEGIFQAITITCPSCKRRIREKIVPEYFTQEELDNLKNSKCPKCIADEKRTPQNQEFLSRIRSRVKV